MNCEELAALIPEMVDGTLSPEVQQQAQAALPNCPECRQELEVALQVRAFLVELQAANTQIRLPAGFETRLIAQIRRQSSQLDLVDLSAKSFGLWLVDLLNLLGGLIDPQANGSFARRTV